MIEKLASRLAGLQDELKAEEEASNEDPAVVSWDGVIRRLEEQLAEAQKEQSATLDIYTCRIVEIHIEIDETKAQIVDVWDGHQKTIATDAGTLKFRTTQSLKIKDDATLLEDVCVRMQSYKEVVKYIKGFNLTAMRKYMTVHPQEPEVAELISKTTVKLEADRDG